MNLREVAAVALGSAAVVVATIVPTPASSQPDLGSRVAELGLKIAASPRDAGLRLERGEIQRNLREWKAAREDLEAARALDRGLAAADLELGRLWFDMGRMDQAVASLDRYLAKRPDHAAALLARARAKARRGSRSDAIADYTSSIEAYRRTGAIPPGAYIERARLIASGGPPHVEEALRGLDDGLSSLGEPAALQLYAADLEVARGSTERAVARLDAVASHAARTQPWRNWREARRRHAGAQADPGAPSAGEPPNRVADRGPTDSAHVTRGPYLQQGTPCGVVVRWRTDRPTDSRVRFRRDSGARWSEKGDSTPTTEHVVEVSGLAPDHRYSYTVGTSTDVLACGAGNCRFVTSPDPAARRPFRVWVLGDSGTADSAARAVRNAYRAFARTKRADLWLMLGDNAYGSGTDEEYQRAVFDMYPDLLRTTVLWPTFGNHDRVSASSTSESGPYFSSFTVPTGAQAGGLSSGTEAYYSFDYANVHFVSLDSEESDRSPDGPMLTWLAADLLSTDRQWIIAFWHHPPFSKGSYDSDVEAELVEMRSRALPILEGAGVDLVLNGHSHAYERSFLLDGDYGTSGARDPGTVRSTGDGWNDGDGAYRKPAFPTPHSGTVYVVAGTGGHTQGGPLDHPSMVRSLDILGSLVLDFAGNRLDATFVDSRGNVQDRFSIVKGADRRFRRAKSP